MKNRQIKRLTMILLAILICSVSSALFSMGANTTPVIDYVAEEKELKTSDTTWYESNENYAIGSFPINEWNPPGVGANRITVIRASTYGVDMPGNAIRLYSPYAYAAADINRNRTFSFDSPNQVLYLTFKARMKPQCDGRGSVSLLYNTGFAYPQVFFGITFVKNSYGHKLQIEFANGHFGSLDYIDLTRVYDFDIMFTKDPTTNLITHHVFIDQKLEFLYKVNTEYYPEVEEVELAMDQQGSGEFFLDNYYLGYVDYEITPEINVITAFPVYYLYVPQLLPGINHVKSTSIKFRYEEIYEQTLSFSLSLGLSCGIGFLIEVPIGDVIPLKDGPGYFVFEVFATDEDAIVFYRIESLISDIIFYLPGIHPDTGVSEIRGMYNYNFIEENLSCASITAFEQEFGALPQEYYDYSYSGNAQFVGTRTIEAQCTGYVGQFYMIDYKVLDLSWEYSWGISVSIPIYKALEFDFGINFEISCTYVITNEIALGVIWDGDQSFSTTVKYDLYAPPEGSYSTSLDLPPYSVRPYLPRVTGLNAVGGDKRITLSWNAITNCPSPFSLHHYNIYAWYRGDYYFGLIGTSNTNSFIHTGLTYSQPFTYKVSAVYYFNGIYYEGPLSDPDSATTDPYTGGGGGCPFLNVFDGVEYIEEGLLDIHDPNGFDLIYEHELITQPARVDNRYLLRLIEHPRTISHIDKVELWGELSNGMIIKLPLLSAIHSEEGQVRFLLWFSDDRKVEELGADHNNGLSQMIDLEFFAPKLIRFRRFVFIIEGNNAFVK